MANPGLLAVVTLSRDHGIWNKGDLTECNRDVKVIH
jgi:hypothetical protein